jgi:hypothetical protein
MSIGDGESQPVEGVSALDDLANLLVVDEQPEVKQPKPKPDDAESDDSEEADESEESEEEEETEEEAEDDTTVKLKVDGKEVEVKLSEALNLAQQGMDYTKKTMAVAEERKAVEAERTKATEFRTQAEQATQETLTRLEAYTKFMESQVGHMPDASMLSYDTNAYIVAKEQYEARKGQLSQAYAEIQKIGQEQARQRQAWINSTAESTEKVLKDTLPGWGDNTLNDLAAYTGTLGLNPQTAELAMLTPGFWQLAHKAQAYDAIQAKKATLKPTEKLAKVIKPSAVNQTGKATERAKREAEFNKNPSVDALANLLR